MHQISNSMFVSIQVVHGDLKTENFFVTSWLHCFLSDFAGFKPAVRCVVFVVFFFVRFAKFFQACGEKLVIYFGHQQFCCRVQSFLPVISEATKCDNQDKSGVIKKLVNCNINMAT